MGNLAVHRSESSISVPSPDGRSSGVRCGGKVNYHRLTSRSTAHAATPDAFLMPTAPAECKAAHIYLNCSHTEVQSTSNSGAHLFHPIRLLYGLPPPQPSRAPPSSLPPAQTSRFSRVLKKLFFVLSTLLAHIEYAASATPAAATVPISETTFLILYYTGVVIL